MNLQYICSESSSIEGATVEEQKDGGTNTSHSDPDNWSLPPAGHSDEPLLLAVGRRPRFNIYRG
jgi:hypothetical protein